MNLRCILPFLLFFAWHGRSLAQEEERAIVPDVTSITINWTWQVQDGDTTSRDFCMLEFALPAEALAGAYCFRMEGLTVIDNQGRPYQANAFAVTSGEQSLHRDYRLLEQQDGSAPDPRFRVRIEDPKKDIEYFQMEAWLDVIIPAQDPMSIQEFSTLDWQLLYEALLPYDIQLVFAAQSRSMIEQMANLGGMSPEAQENLNTFLENYSMYLQEPLYPENTNLLLNDPNNQILKIETLGPDGQPISFKDRRAYSSGTLHIEQQYNAPLLGQEKVRAVIATKGNKMSIPIRMERVLLPW